MSTLTQQVAELEIRINQCVQIQIDILDEIKKLHIIVQKLEQKVEQKNNNNKTQKMVSEIRKPCKRL